MQLIHWLALVGVIVAVIMFFGATTKKRLRGDVALAVMIISAVLFVLYLLSDAS